MKEKIIQGEDLVGKTFLVQKNGLLKLLKDKFEPYHGQTYYYVTDDYVVANTLWRSFSQDVIRHKVHNVFRTFEDADLFRKYKLRKFELSSDFKVGNANYYIFYDSKLNQILIAHEKYNTIPGVDYFRSSTFINTLFDEFGIKNVLKWEFGIYQD